MGEEWRMWGTVGVLAILAVLAELLAASEGRLTREEGFSLPLGRADGRVGAEVLAVFEASAEGEARASFELVFISA